MKKRIISTILVIAILCTSLCITAFADNSTKIASSPFTEAYHALPDDAIVCYAFGEPIYKYEIDENGFIDKDFSTTTRNHSSYYTESSIPVLMRNKSIVAEGHLSATGYHQYDTFLYLTPLDGAQYASKLATNSSVEIRSFLIGLVFPASTALTVLLGICSAASIYLNSYANDIRARTDIGKGCIFLTMRNPYGTFRVVHDWDRLACIRYGQTLSEGTSYVDSVYTVDGSSVW